MPKQMSIMTSKISFINNYLMCFLFYYIIHLTKPKVKYIIFI